MRDGGTCCKPEVIRVVATRHAVLLWCQIEESQFWLLTKSLYDLHRISQILQRRRKPVQNQYCCRRISDLYKTYLVGTEVGSDAMSVERELDFLVDLRLDD